MIDISNILKNLKIDVWYKALFYISSIILVLALFVEVKGISNGQLQLLSGGAMLVGLGEWKNRKVASWIKPPNAYTGPATFINAPIRQPDALGVFLNVIGVVLMSGGVLWIILAAVR